MSLSAKVDITNIKEFLNKTIKVYEKTDYKKNFGWIDFIKEIKDANHLNKLNTELIKKINTKDNYVWIAAPEIIDWSQFVGFKYSKRKKDILYDELDIEDFINCFDNVEEIDLNHLHDTYITCWSQENDNYDYYKDWRVYHCLNAEIDYKGDKYFLANSKWYKIDKNYVEEVNKDYESTNISKLAMVEYDDVNENEYNIRAADKLNALCLDQKLIIYGGGASKVEFCDILLPDKIIHVKKYAGSAVLSHLFSQGYVSAELFATDSNFRTLLVTNIVPKNYKYRKELSSPKISKYEIVYAIIHKDRDYKMPFFSKVVLKNTKRVLEGFGYSVSLCKIKNNRP